MDVDTLRQKILFLGLTDGQLLAISNVLRTRTCRAGETIVREGDLDDTLHIVERGSAELRVRDRTVTIFERGSYVDEDFAGDFFGEFSLVDLERWRGDVVARERTVLLELRRDDVFELFSKDIDLQIGVVMNVARMLSRRLRIHNRRLATAG